MSRPTKRPKPLKRKHDSDDIHVSFRKVQPGLQPAPERPSGPIAPTQPSFVRPQVAAAGDIRTRHCLRLRVDIGHHAISSKRRTSLDIYRLGEFYAPIDAHGTHAVHVNFSLQSSVRPQSVWQRTFRGAGDVWALHTRLRKLGAEFRGDQRLSGMSCNKEDVIEMPSTAKGKDAVDPVACYTFGKEDEPFHPVWSLADMSNSISSITVPSFTDGLGSAEPAFPTPAALQFTLRFRAQAKKLFKPLHLLELPLELKRQIFSYLVTDLKISSTLFNAGRSFNCLAADDNDGWKVLLRTATVSRAFKGMLHGAIAWAADRKDIHLVIDAGKMRTDNPQDPRTPSHLLVAPPPPKRIEHSVPRKILHLFRSAVFTIPIISTISGECQNMKHLRVDVQQNQGGRGFHLASAIWTTLRAADYYPNNMSTAPVFDTLETFIRDGLLGILAMRVGSRSFEGVFISRMLYTLAFRPLRRFIMHTPNGTFRIKSMVEGADSQFRLAELEEFEQSRSGDSPSQKFKLAWRGTPAAASWTPPFIGDGMSFLAKWKMCAELINNRRWNEPKIAKLGWHGSRTLAETRRTRRETEAQQFLAITDWISQLSAPSATAVAHDSQPGVVGSAQIAQV